jgi:hypothetical protein
LPCGFGEFRRSWATIRVSTAARKESFAGDPSKSLFTLFRRCFRPDCHRRKDSIFHSNASKPKNELRDAQRSTKFIGWLYPGAIFLLIDVHETGADVPASRNDRLLSEELARKAAELQEMGAQISSRIPPESVASGTFRRRSALHSIRQGKPLQLDFL